MKDSYWYVVQVSDTTMMTIAASLHGQKISNLQQTMSNGQ